MQLFRQMACKQVEVGDHESPIVLTGNGNTFLYQAYLGRIQVSSNNTFEVFLDDEAIRVGTPSTLVGDVARTWYDGISYASVNTVTSVSESKAHPIEFSLGQNYPNPFNPTTTITVALPFDATVSLVVYNTLGQKVAELMNGTASAGYHAVVFDASNLASGLYTYRMVATGNDGKDFTKNQKMMLLK
jgi:hypothetical protein